jgi:hypothetical protein
VPGRLCEGPHATARCEPQLRIYEIYEKTLIRSICVAGQCMARGWLHGRLHSSKAARLRLLFSIRAEVQEHCTAGCRNTWPPSGGMSGKHSARR